MGRAAGLLTLCCVLAGTMGQGITMSDEKRLIKYLLENYDRVGKVGRPVYNNTDVVVVDLMFSPVRINSLDLEKEVLDSLGWVSMTWEDILLRWDPDDFGGVDVISVPADGIWIPDVVLFNTLQPAVQLFGVLAVVKASGQVWYAPTYQLHSICAVPDSMKDSPECPLTFGSWVHNSERLQLTYSQQTFDPAFYHPSKEFELLSVRASDNLRRYKCCPGESYTDITYTVKLQRRPRDDDNDDQ